LSSGCSCEWLFRALAVTLSLAGLVVAASAFLPALGLMPGSENTAAGMALAATLALLANTLIMYSMWLKCSEP